MNAVEIEEAISILVLQPFEAGEFAFAFLEAFGNKATTIKRLRSGASNASDIAGGVLQRTNIHIAVCNARDVSKTLAALKASPATAKAKAKFVLATDGVDLEAEDVASGETVACSYVDFPNHFGFFLPLAGITTVKQIRNNPIDIQATGRLNRLYVELLRENPDWDTAERRNDMNQFMARLIFCFFAEDTELFRSPHMFTETVEQMSETRSGNTHEVIAELFHAMDTPIKDRGGAGIPRWADAFPWVNGGLFGGAKEVPRFSRIARSYLLHAGRLDWQKINPDIFGSMIQAVAEADERGELGLHYTSVPNILKVLNPLFLDNLRDQLEKAGDNARKLLNLRKRIARIRVFDPACGSGNFLVIAYIQMREIETEILRRRDEVDRRSWIRLENFYGIEIKDFACEVARLSLLIAEFQCDVRLIGQKEAKELVLPLKQTGQIYCGNALRMDWLTVCPPIQPLLEEHDLAGPTGEFALADSDEPEVETYICGNPPYSGKGKKTNGQLSDMELIFRNRTKKWGYIDYVGCWILLSSDYCRSTNAAAALVATNSVCQGRQLPQLWPYIIGNKIEIGFAHRSFKWSNSAIRNAGVSCVVLGLFQKHRYRRKIIFENGHARAVDHINAYLINAPDRYVNSVSKPLSTDLTDLVTGSVLNDDGNLILSFEEKSALEKQHGSLKRFIHPFFGSEDFLQGKQRYCLVISDEYVEEVKQYTEISRRLDSVASARRKSKKKEAREILSRMPHRFQHTAGIPAESAIIVPSVSSERREWFPVGVVPAGTVISNLAFMMLDAAILYFALSSSRIHLVWIATVCGKLETRYRYSNTLGWNTFPVPKLTEQNKADLTRCAEDILLAREARFPATIADLYDPEKMPADLRGAHERNDEVLERIYIGRRFRNDTERLEKLFDLYTKMTGAEARAGGRKTEGKAKAAQEAGLAD